MLMSNYYKMSNCNSKDEERGKEKDDPIFMIETKYYFVTNILKNQSQYNIKILATDWLQYGTHIIQYSLSIIVPGTRT